MTEAEEAFTEAVREALAIMACRHAGDEEGVRAIIDGSPNEGLIAAAVFYLLDGALTEHGTDPAQWAAGKQAFLLAAEAQR